MRARFHAAESQLGDEAQGGEGGAAPAQLSLFQMAGRLSRMEAAKLFYQVLGALEWARLGGGRLGALGCCGSSTVCLLE